MEFDFKITTWERVTVDEDQEEKVLQAIKEGKIESAEDVINFLAEEGDMNFGCRKLEGVDEQMTVEENGGSATIEVFDGLKPIYKNGE